MDVKRLPMRVRSRLERFFYMPSWDQVIGVVLAFQEWW